MKLSDYAKPEDTMLDRIDYPLLRAMASGVKELEVTPDEFVMAMRYAINADLYKYVDECPTILAMKIRII